MPRTNRVDPWGDLHAVADRGLFTGNRGCLVDDTGALARHHRGSLWITCVTTFRDRRHPLDAPRRWTPVFFLDEAVALAAGHRPCGECRRAAYRSYRDAVVAGLTRSTPVLATELNRRLGAERLRRGRGLTRRTDRRLWPALLDALPPGTIVAAGDGGAQLVLSDRLVTFGFDGWRDPVERPIGRTVEVLTPPTSVLALELGFQPVLHPTAAS